MKNTPSRLIAAAAVLCICAGARAEPSPQEVTFHFAPSDGTRVSQTLRQSRTRVIGDQAQRTDEAEITTSGTFKRVGEVFEYSPKVTAFSVKRNGQPVSDPIMATLANIPTTYVISKGGEATEIRGYSEVESVIKATLPPELAKAVAPLLNEAALAARDKAEWNARYADFAEGTFKIGAVVDAKTPYQLPNGEKIEYTIRTRLPGWTDCPAGRCVRIEQVFESDAQALARLVDGFVNNVAAGVSGTATTRPPLPKAGPTVRISGSMTRIIDPKTMLIYSERMERTVTMPFQIPGQGQVASEQKELRVYTYSYE